MHKNLYCESLQLCTTSILQLSSTASPPFPRWHANTLFPHSLFPFAVPHNSFPPIAASSHLPREAGAGGNCLIGMSFHAYFLRECFAGVLGGGARREDEKWLLAPPPQLEEREDDRAAVGVTYRLSLSLKDDARWDHRRFMPSPPPQSRGGEAIEPTMPKGAAGRRRMEITRRRLRTYR